MRLDDRDAQALARPGSARRRCRRRQRRRWQRHGCRAGSLRCPAQAAGTRPRKPIAPATSGDDRPGTWPSAISPKERSDLHRQGWVGRRPRQAVAEGQRALADPRGAPRHRLRADRPTPGSPPSSSSASVSASRRPRLNPCAPIGWMVCAALPISTARGADQPLGEHAHDRIRAATTDPLDAPGAPAEAALEIARSNAASSIATIASASLRGHGADGAVVAAHRQQRDRPLPGEALVGGAVGGAIGGDAANQQGLPVVVFLGGDAELAAGKRAGAVGRHQQSRRDRAFLLFAPQSHADEIILRLDSRSRVAGRSRRRSARSARRRSRASPNSRAVTTPPKDSRPVSLASRRTAPKSPARLTWMRRIGLGGARSSTTRPARSAH